MEEPFARCRNSPIGIEKSQSNSKRIFDELRQVRIDPGNIMQSSDQLIN
jgi:hypothetical protein